MTPLVETVDVDVPVTQAYQGWIPFESFPRSRNLLESITGKLRVIEALIEGTDGPTGARRDDAGHKEY